MSVARPLVNRLPAIAVRILIAASVIMLCVCAIDLANVEIRNLVAVSITPKAGFVGFPKELLIAVVVLVLFNLPAALATQVLIWSLNWLAPGLDSGARLAITVVFAAASCIAWWVFLIRRTRTY